MGDRLYTIYRKIRYLHSKGTLFSLKTTENRGLVEYPRNTFNIISINSLVFFMLGYLIIYLIYLFGMGISATAFDIPVVVYYYDVDFLIRGNEWTTDAVTSVFSAGPLLTLVAAISLLILFINVALETGILRLLVIWMLFHSLTRFFGEILVGAIMTRGLGYVILYFFIMDTGKLIITIFAFVAMFSTGLLLTRLVMYSGSSYFNDLRGSNRFRLIWHQYMVPYFLGNALIFLIKIPQINLFDIALNASMILILIPIAMRSFSMGDLYFDDEPRKINFLFYLTLATFFLLVLFRVVFGIGVRIF